MNGPVKDYVCLDLETSGLYPRLDKIIEIGAVKVLGGVAGAFSDVCQSGA
ncbi:MAG: exonuclease domain-containing protein [Eisenbergiella massiliensis]